MFFVRCVELSNRSVDILSALLLHFYRKAITGTVDVTKVAHIFAPVVHATINERSHG
jgi:hypothetical protein